MGRKVRDYVANEVSKSLGNTKRTEGWSKLEVIDWRAVGDEKQPEAFEIIGTNTEALILDPFMSFDDIPVCSVFYHMNNAYERNLLLGFMKRGIQNGWLEGHNIPECLDYMVDHKVSIGVPAEWIK